MWNSSADDVNISNRDDEKKCAIWRRRTVMERHLILICLALFIAMISFIIILIFYNHVYKHSMRNICISPECKREAGVILKNMDSSVNPCEDFYNFACGSFMKYERLSDERVITFLDGLEYILRYSKEVLEAADEISEPDFVRKVKKFYQSCMDRPSDTAEIINELLTKSKIRIWPFPVYGISIDGLPTLEEALSNTATANQIGGKMALFDLSNHRGHLMLDKGSRFVDEDMLLNTIDDELIKRKQKYRRLMAWTLFLVQRPSYDLEDEVDDIIDFQTSLAKISSYATEENETIITVSDLESICPEIKWTSFGKHIYEKFGHAATVDNLNETVITVHNIGYIKDLCQLLDETDPEIIHNLLVWNFLGEALIWLDSSFHQSFKEIDPSNDKLQGIDNRFYSMRWKDCINAVRKSKVIHPGLDYLIIEAMNPERQVKEVKGYMKNVKAAMDRTFANEDWLDDHTREILRNNLRQLPGYIGFSKISRNINMLAKHFSKVIVTDSYVENWIQNRNHLFAAYFFKKRFLLQTMTQIEEPMHYGARNTGYTFVIPLGIFVPPVYTPGVPQYLNYGAMGFIIAHEISHTFDNLGEGFTSINTSKEVIETFQKFEMKSECYANQYSKLPLDKRGLKVDGKRTIRDIIADNSGIVQAFTAYKDYLDRKGEEEYLPALNYTNPQMFFIKYAQLFCELIESPDEFYMFNMDIPHKYRLLIPLMNFPSFSQEFRCPLDSPMNPRNKCQMWG